jgi:hypothetical protein
MTYDTRVRTLQGGDTLQVTSGGTIEVQAGAVFLLGGTAARTVGGTVAIAGGVGTIGTGLTTVYGAAANPALAAVGTYGGININYSLAAQGSLIMYAVGGTTAVAGGVTSWIAYGV